MKALARVYLKTNRLDEARKLMEAASQADPSLKQSTLLQNFNEEFKPASAAKKKKSYRKGPKKSRKAKISRKKRTGGKAKVSGRKKKTGGKAKVSSKKKAGRSPKKVRR